MTQNALFHRYALNKKGQVSPKKMFDADKARKMVDKDMDGWKKARDLGVNTRHVMKLQNALKGFTPNFKQF
ncbi:hypothetical protein RY280_23655 [Bacillus paralicheniformis]|uniref:hypothetical protein n=1 Tax=Bacillus paralicheniformis TaxID=1648923 RepID=UPI00203E7724|nr:hypothetical protein [Bacillus paralicheniformis]MCM3425562.1 hypothetical protein [Bacillus paralicheniformis]